MTGLGIRSQDVNTFCAGFGLWKKVPKLRDSLVHLHATCMYRTAVP